MNVKISKRLQAELIEIQATEHTLYDNALELGEILEMLVYEPNSPIRSRGWAWSQDIDGAPMRVLRISRSRKDDENGSRQETDAELCYKHLENLHTIDDMIALSEADEDVKEVLHKSYEAGIRDFEKRIENALHIDKMLEKQRQEWMEEDEKLAVIKRRAKAQNAMKSVGKSYHNPHDVIRSL